MTPRIGKDLGIFHHRLAFRLEGMQPTRDTAGRGDYLPLGEVMSAVGIKEVETYFLCR